MPDKRTTIILFLAAALLIAFLIVFIAGEAERSPANEICDLQDNDGDGQVDEGFAVTCSQDSDCGPSGEFGERFCRDGDVWGSYYVSECTSEPGTCLSTCSSRQEERLVQPCTQGCSAGRCA